MPQRPTSLVGLTVHYAKTKWAGFGTGARLLVVAVAVVGSLGLLSAARYAVYGSACAGGCPYSAHAQSPCGG